jgi:GAF domain-containing protein
LAAASVGCDEGSVIVREGDEGGLKFLVAIGQVADKLMGMTIPPGKGIAGFVFASGQPMAVADARQAEGFYSGIDDQTGYKTDTLLTTPLRAGEEVVGVLQFVNREGEPLVNESGDSYYPPFTPEEMDRAAYFADAIATLVEAHEASGLVENLFQRAMDAESLMAAATNGSGGAAKGRRKASPVQKWLQSVRAAPEHKDMVGMAVALREVASRGEAERHLCREGPSPWCRSPSRQASRSSAAPSQRSDQPTVPDPVSRSGLPRRTNFRQQQAPSRRTALGPMSHPLVAPPVFRLRAALPPSPPLSRRT